MPRENQVSNVSGRSLRARTTWVFLLSAAFLFGTLALADDPPPSAKPEAQGQPPSTAPAKQPPKPPAGSGIDADAIRRLIEAKLKAAPKLPKQPVKPPPARRGKPSTSSSLKPWQRAPGAQRTVTTQPGAKPAKRGCGGQSSGIDLTPPPPDQPQPRWVCEKPEVEIEPVWRGEQANFVFKISNAGEGPLNIKLRGG